MVTKKDLGSKIRELRSKLSMSQKNLGSLLGKSHAAISDIERGKTDLTVRDLYKISNCLNVPIDFFLKTYSITIHSQGKPQHLKFEGFRLTLTENQHSDTIPLSSISEIDNSKQKLNITPSR